MYLQINKVHCPLYKAFTNPSNDEANEVHAPKVHHPKLQSCQSVQLSSAV